MKTIVNKRRNTHLSLRRGESQSNAEARQENESDSFDQETSYERTNS
jgi:hypothetical protein